MKRRIDQNAREINADVAVAGNGIAGSVLACLLASAGLEVAAIDRTALLQRLDPGFDGRTTAISFGSSRILEAAGLWDALVPHACAIEQIRIADGESPLFLHFAHEAVENRPFGWIVENRLIRAALAERLAALPGIRDLCPATVTGYQAGTARAILSLEDGRTVSAPLIVAADGRDSTLRGLAGIASRKTTYAQTALAFAVTHEYPHDHVALEQFHPAGPFAVLPMVDDAGGRHRSSVVWTVESDDAARLMALDETAFDAALAPMFGEYWGKTRLAGRRFVYPLGLVRAERYFAPRLALAGEAAHAIHPIAGQGLNLSLRDVALLAELIVDHARLGLDIGAPQLLRDYGARREGDTFRLAFATDTLNRLFSNDLAPVRLARGLGLGVVQGLPALKRFFMLTAMGLAGAPPRLVRGEKL
jgi:2-octaprenyl-6-methoxyphenol hydroxylase